MQNYARYFPVISLLTVKIYFFTMLVYRIPDGKQAILTRSADKNPVSLPILLKTGIPEFYLHHGFIDKIWDDWQKRSKEHMAYYGSISTSMTATIYSPKDVNDLKNQPGILLSCVISAYKEKQSCLLLVTGHIEVLYSTRWRTCLLHQPSWFKRHSDTPYKIAECRCLTGKNIYSTIIFNHVPNQR